MKCAIMHPTYIPWLGYFDLIDQVDGLGEEELSLCDSVLEIPMHGKKGSLNVSVAFGVVAYYLALSTFAA